VKAIAGLFANAHGENTHLDSLPSTHYSLRLECGVSLRPERHALTLPGATGDDFENEPVHSERNGGV